MKAEAQREFIVTLTLSEQEARWLKALVQNPLSDDESTDAAAMRKIFWEALAGVRI